MYLYGFDHCFAVWPGVGACLAHFNIYQFVVTCVESLPRQRSLCDALLVNISTQPALILYLPTANELTCFICVWCAYLMQKLLRPRVLFGSDRRGDEGATCSVTLDIQ